jgi:subtilisin family serine protease
MPAYYSDDGTSFAAPFVSGLAAMIMLKYPGLAPDQVRSIIERSATDIETPGYDIYSGWGRIDMARALNQDYNAPEKSNTYNWPNPFSPGMNLYTNIVFQLPAAADISISIYDAGGDLVWKKELATGQTAAGNNSTTWDGRNLSGKTVAAGTYFYVIKTPSGNGKNKIVVIH